MNTKHQAVSAQSYQSTRIFPSPSTYELIQVIRQTVNPPYSLPIATVADKIGISVSKARDLLKLSSAGPAILNQLKDGSISVECALKAINRKH